MRKYVFMACPQMTDLANRVASLYYRRERNVARSISWQTFEHDYPKIWIDTDDVRDQDVVFLASFDNPIECFSQYCALSAIARYGAHSLKIMLPFFPTGTMDRVVKHGDVATAKSLTRLLDSIPETKHGKPEVVIFDIHATQEEFFFERAFGVLETAMILPKRLMMDKFRSDHGSFSYRDFFAAYSVCFPDEGSKKRFSSEFPVEPKVGWDQIICDKIRGEGDERIVTVKEGNARGRHVMIVDDLTRTGGTLIKSAEAIRKMDPLSVSGFVSHGAFDREGFTKILAALDAKLIDNFFVTDSCPQACEMIAKAGRDDFSVLSLDRLIVDYLLKLEELRGRRKS